MKLIPYFRFPMRRTRQAVPHAVHLTVTASKTIMQLEQIRKSLSVKDIELLLLIDSHTQWPSSRSVETKVLIQKTGLTDSQIQDAVDVAGIKHCRRYPVNSIEITQAFRTFVEQLKSKPTVDYHAQVSTAWKTNPWLGIPAGLAGIALLMLAGYLVFKPAIDAVLKRAFE